MNQLVVQLRAPLLVLFGLLAITVAVAVVKPDAWGILAAAWLGTGGGITNARLIPIYNGLGLLRYTRGMLLLPVLPLLSLAGGRSMPRESQGAPGLGTSEEQGPGQYAMANLIGELRATGHVHRREFPHDLEWMWLLTPDEYEREIKELKKLACSGRPFTEVKRAIADRLSASRNKAIHHFLDDPEFAEFLKEELP